ncbi:MAG: hypothetical protein JNM67_06285 [Bacteroidetes bacterium]|nr:hypothetical protein [Bacteroidota bacterium]
MTKPYPHYSSFGSLISNRSWSDASREYRFGFNTQEKDNEVAGKGNSYTAAFWQYDCRLGRRFNLDIDGKIWLSAYSTLANNPILFIDWQGDKFGKHSDLVDKLEKEINEIKSNFKWVSDFYQRRINEKKEKLRKRGKSEEEINSNRKIKRLEQQKKVYDDKIKECDEAIAEIDVMRKSDWTYDINVISLGKGEDGNVKYNTKSNNIDIYISSKLTGNEFMAALSHEMKHAYQFEVGKIAFVFIEDGKSGTVFLDVQDEIEAYKREQLIFGTFKSDKIDKDFIVNKRGYYWLKNSYGQNVVNMCSQDEMVNYYYYYNINTYLYDKNNLGITGLII